MNAERQFISVSRLIKMADVTNLRTYRINKQTKALIKFYKDRYILMNNQTRIGEMLAYHTARNAVGLTPEIMIWGFLLFSSISKHAQTPDLKTHCENYIAFLDNELKALGLSIEA